MGFVLEIQPVHWVFIEKKDNADLVHPIVLNVFLNRFVRHASLDSKLIQWNMIRKLILIVYKFVVMEKDFSLIVMMEITRMATVAAANARYKKDGTAKEVLLLSQVLVSVSLLLVPLLP